MDLDLEYLSERIKNKAYSLDAATEADFNADTLLKMARDTIKDLDLFIDHMRKLVSNANQSAPQEESGADPRVANHARSFGRPITDI